MKLSFFFVILILYLSQAYIGTEHLHPDEHYQIIEFAQYKLGYNSAFDLPWEFRAQIRPAIQPFICYSLFKFFHFLNINNPFSMTMWLRIITAIYSAFSLYYFTNAVEKLVKDKTRWMFYVISISLWFLPFINVRFSSETWSGLLFLNAISIFLYSKNKRQYILIGILLGLSFLFRFQVAILSFGFICWLLFVHRLPITCLLKILIGGFLAILLGFILDYWFYGRIVFTAYEYFDTNIVHSIASAFGTSPWYFYVIESIKKLYMPIGILVWSGLLILAYREPKNIFIWIILPFLFIHTIIPHKEMRFLFPIVNFLPIVITLSLQATVKQFILKAIVIIFVILNLIILSITFIAPVGNGRLILAKYIDEKFSDESFDLIYMNQSCNPYQPYSFLQQNFYRPKSSNFILIENDKVLKKEMLINNLSLIILRKSDLSKKNVQSILKEFNAVLLKSIYPDWLGNIKKTFQFQPFTNDLYIYELNKASQ